MSAPAQYEVLTYDLSTGEFTPQEGVPTGPYTRMELRAVLRRLRDMGYTCDYRSRDGGDPSVLIQRIGGGD